MSSSKVMAEARGWPGRTAQSDPGWWRSVFHPTARRGDPCADGTSILKNSKACHSADLVLLMARIPTFSNTRLEAMFPAMMTAITLSKCSTSNACCDSRPAASVAIPDPPLIAVRCREGRCDSHPGLFRSCCAICVRLIGRTRCGVPILKDRNRPSPSVLHLPLRPMFRKRGGEHQDVPRLRGAQRGDNHPWFIESRNASAPASKP